MTLLTKPYHMKTIPAVMLAAVLAASCAVNHDAETARNTATAENLRRHTEALSHDSCQGRKPFSEGAARAVEYIAGQMKEIGLEPCADGSYLQQVGIRSATVRCTGPMVINLSLIHI